MNNIYKLSFAQFITNFGSSLDWLALAFYFSDKFSVSKALILTILICCKRLPATIASLFFSKFIDHNNKRLLMIFSDAIAAFVCILLAFSIKSSILLSFTLIFIQSIFVQTFMLSQKTFIKILSPEDKIDKSTSLSEMARTAGLSLGMIIGGLLYEYSLISYFLIFDGLTFIASAILTLLIEDKSKYKITYNFMTSTISKNALLYILRRKKLLYIIILSALRMIPFCFLQNMGFLLPQSVYNLSNFWISFSIICITISSVIAGIIFPLLSKRLSSNVQYSGTSLLAFSMFIIFLLSYNKNPILGFLSIVLISSCEYTNYYLEVTTIYKNTENNLLSQVFGIESVISMTIFTIFNIIWSSISDYIGVLLMLRYQSVLSIITIICFYLFIKHFERDRAICIKKKEVVFD